MRHTELFLFACKLMKKEGLSCLLRPAVKGETAALHALKATRQEKTEGAVFTTGAAIRGTKKAVYYLANPSKTNMLSPKEVGQLVAQCLARAGITVEWTGEGTDPIWVSISSILEED